MNKYIVRMPFVNYGKVYAAGSLIENPAEIKRIKSKVRNRDVIIVTEQTLALWTQYFKTRHRVDISAYFKETPKPTVKPVEQEKEKMVPVVKLEFDAKEPEEKKEPVVAKVTTDAVVTAKVVK